MLYAWLQCHSEKVSIDNNARRVLKSQVKWVAIEKDFTRKVINEKTNKEEEVKVMNRKTIAKYFAHLEDKKLIWLGKEDEGEDPNYYYLTVLNRQDGHLIDYKTLSKLTNVLQKNSLSIYIYLFNRYCAAGYEPVIVTMKQVKDHIGIATSTTSNNIIIADTIDILKRLGLLNYQIVHQDEKTFYEFKWVKNKLP